jgi:hypothetical protein
MELEQTGAAPEARASALEVDRLLTLASREELAECLRLLAVALAITAEEKEAIAPPPSRAATTAELDAIIEGHYPRAMLTLASFLRGVLEDTGTAALH